MHTWIEQLTTAISHQYAIEKEVGAGGTAVVFLAHDLKHDRKVALKVLRPELAALLGRDRFLTEIKTTANLQHPHLLPLFDSGEAGGFVYYVMPYVEGESLRARLLREHRLPVNDAVRIAREVADALGYAHSRGIVHRDIKPENILLSGEHAVVADFGIARAIDLAGSSRLTETGIVVGTPAYMSPEQAVSGGPADRQTDIYALGCVLFEMLTGEVPLGAASAPALLARRLREPAPSARTTRFDLPDAFDAVLLRMLAADPALRYGNAKDVVEALSVATTPDRMRDRRTASLLVAGAAVLVVAVSAVGRVISRPAPADKSANASIAVFPFTVTGEGQGVWREGVMELVGTNLDRVTDLRTVPSQTVMARVHKLGQASARFDLNAATDIAVAAGARYALLGTVVALSSRSDVRLASTLYDLADGSIAAHAEVQGPLDSMLVLVDRLTINLVREISKTSNILPRYLNLSAVTTTSLPALKLYLEGISLYRSAAIDQSIALLEQAVAADSTFALAWHYLASAINWRQAPSPQGAAARAQALRLISRLPPREAALVGLTRGGHETIDAARRTAELYPDDAEIAYTIGDRILHSGMDGLVDQAESAHWFRRAIELDPRYGPAYIHAIEVAVLAGDTAQARTLLEAYGEIAPDSEASLRGLRILLATLASDKPPVTSLRALADTTALLNLQWAGARLLSGFDQSGTFGLWPPTLEAAEVIAGAARSRADHPPWASNRAVNAAVLRGRVALAREIFEAESRFDPPYRALFYDRLKRLGYALAPEVESRELVPQPQDTAFPVRNLVLGAHAARRRQWQNFNRAVENHRHKLTRAEATGDTTAIRIRRAEVQALLAYGDAHRNLQRHHALASLEACRKATSGGTNALIRRWLAELHEAAGNHQEALRYYGTFASDPLSVLAMARIAEKLGNVEEARRKYAVVAEAWKDADPDFPPAAQIRAALKRLGIAEPPRN